MKRPGAIGKADDVVDELKLLEFELLSLIEHFLEFLLLLLLEDGHAPGVHLAVLLADLVLLDPGLELALPFELDFLEKLL